MYLAVHPLCENPHGRHDGPVAAVEVDHIQPRSVRPDLSYDFDNMMALCKSCHSTKTANEMHAKRRRTSPKC